jgi:hypothetical protein
LELHLMPLEWLGDAEGVSFRNRKRDVGVHDGRLGRWALCIRLGCLKRRKGLMVWTSVVDLSGKVSKNMPLRLSFNSIRC